MEIIQVLGGELEHDKMYEAYEGTLFEVRE